MLRPRALCVTSPNWLGTAYLPRLLKQAGYQVTLLAHPHSYAAKSRCVEHLIPASWDPAVNVEILRKHLDEQTLAYDWFTLGDDPTLWEVLRRRQEPWTAACLPIDPAGMGAQLLISKASFMVEALKRGLPIPPSRMAASRDALGEAAGSLGFPVIIKPVQGSGGRGIFTARSMDELRQSARSAEEGAYLVQRLISGQVGSTAVLFDRGTPRAWLPSYKRKVFPEPYGQSTARQRVHLPDSEETLTRFGRMLGAHGIMAFDWILPDDGGQALIFECNGRPPSYMYMIEEVGLDLAGAIADMRTRERLRTPPPETMGDEIAIFPQNAVRAIALSDWKRLASWLLSPPGPLPWNEPRILAAQFRFLAGLLYRKLLTSLRPSEQRHPPKHRLSTP
jgi:hypothetical protein